MNYYRKFTEEYRSISFFQKTLVWIAMIVLLFTPTLLWLFPFVFIGTFFIMREMRDRGNNRFISSFVGIVGAFILFIGALFPVTWANPELAEVPESSSEVKKNPVPISRIDDTPKTEKVKAQDTAIKPEVKTDTPNNKYNQQTSPKETSKDIKLRQLEREKAELEKQAERAQKTAEYYKGVENLRKENAERAAASAKEQEQRNLEREAEKRKREEERLAEDLAIAIELEERLAEQEYNSCVSERQYCMDGISRKVSASLGSLGSSSSAAGQMYSALQRECQRKYQCIR